MFEAAGYSPLAPVALNMLRPRRSQHAPARSRSPSEHQKEEWLRPLAAGRDPLVLHDDRAGAGRRRRPVDAADDRARATATSGDFVIDGDQMADHRRGRRRVRDHHGARTRATRSGRPARRCSWRRWTRRASISSGCSTRSISTWPAAMRSSGSTGCGCPKARCSAGSAQGFRYAQVRLAPARLTHCMRWLGAARRAHDIATDYARRRTAFGKPLGEHEGVGFMLADNEMDIHTEPAGDLAHRLGARPRRARPPRIRAWPR